jgi:hypothetical protein
VRCTRNQWAALKRYGMDGRPAIDNNAGERAEERASCREDGSRLASGGADVAGA